MKKKGLLFSILSTLCLGLVSGCGDPSYYINMVAVSNEFGSVEGSGNYKIGATATMKVYENVGCHTSEVRFIKNGENTSVATNINLAWANDGGYKYYQFLVTEENIGKYEVNFTCDTNTVDNLTAQDAMKHKVTYTLLVLDEKTGEFVVANDVIVPSNVPENVNVKEVVSGGKAEDIPYIDTREEKIVWHTKDAGNNYIPYDFSVPLTGNVDLYGKLQKVSNEQLIIDAIDAFKSNNNFVVYAGGAVEKTLDAENKFDYFGDTFKVDGNKIINTTNNNTNNASDIEIKNSTFSLKNAAGKEFGFFIYGNNVYQLEKASIKNLKEGVNSDKFEMEVKGYDYSNKYLVQKNKLFIDQNNNKAGFELKDESSGFMFDDIESLYKFVFIKDILVTDFKENLGDNEYTYDVEKEINKVNLNGVDCDVYKLKRKGTNNVYLTLYIYRGMIYRFDTIDSGRYVEYLEGNPSGTTVSNARDMYLIRLYSDDTTLNAKLDDLNTDFNKILKIVPSYGQTLENLIKDQSIHDILKEYDFTWNEYKSNSCTNTSYDINKTIDSHLKLCLKVKDSITRVKESIEKMKTGNFKIETTINVEGFGTVAPRIYEVSSGVNVFDVSDKDLDDTTKLHPVVFAAKEELEKLLEDKDAYHHFKYEYNDIEETGVYKFYKNEKDSVAYITIYVKEGKVKSFVYYDNENTYTSEVKDIS